MSDRWSGYIVGTVNDPGSCQKCGRWLHRGDRAAICYPLTIQCLDCANAKPKYTEREDIVLPVVAAVMFLLAIAFGLAQ